MDHQKVEMQSPALGIATHDHNNAYKGDNVHPDLIQLDVDVTVGVQPPNIGHSTTTQPALSRSHENGHTGAELDEPELAQLDIERHYNDGQNVDAQINGDGGVQKPLAIVVNGASGSRSSSATREINSANAHVVAELLMQNTRSSSLRKSMLMNRPESQQHLFIIRHGESQYNEFRKKSIRNMYKSCDIFRDPMIYDAPLTTKGHQQVHALRKQVHELNLDKTVELVVVSPLTRALQTAVGAFGECDIPFEVLALHRERTDTSCDVGRKPSQLAAEFPELDFSALEEDWWVWDKRRYFEEGSPQIPKEPFDRFKQRVIHFQQWIASRPERRIAIVGHSGFFMHFLGMWSKLPNCELHYVTMSGNKIHRRRKGSNDIGSYIAEDDRFEDYDDSSSVASSPGPSPSASRKFFFGSGATTPTTMRPSTPGVNPTFADTIHRAKSVFSSWSHRGFLSGHGSDVDSEDSGDQQMHRGGAVGQQSSSSKSPLHTQ
eukprot:GFYU01006025.1.p1 GENE.GFYU01006025.1~~GFYU01006025.1.p1  ORF type:complete len:489 (-),score=65.94 GFYU01006025.1:132-1598(-)